MKIFITGADGVLGNNLVRILLERGNDVKVLVEKGKQAKYLQDLPVEKCTGSILDYDWLSAEMKSFDIVIHAAAKTDTWPPRHESYYEVNVGGTKNVIKAVSENKISRLLHIGTANSFGPGSKEQPGNEKNEFDGAKYKLDYITSKYEAQKEVLRSVEQDGLDAVVLNPTFMIGPYDSKPSSGQMIMAVNEGKVPGYPPGGRNFVYVKDVANAIANAIERGRKGECYILGNENLSYKEAFGKMAAALGVKAPGMKMPAFLTLAYGAVMSVASALFRFRPPANYPMALISTEKHYYSNAKAVKELLMPQTNIEDALEEAISWFRANKYF